MRTVLQIVGLGVAGVLVFYLALHLTFPSRAVSNRVAFEAQERLDLAVKVTKPRPKGISGVRFRSLELGKLTDDGSPPRTLLSMGRTWIKVKPLAALRGRYDATFDGVIYDGNARGTLLYSEEQIAADVELDELEVRAFPLQGETWSIDGAGTFDSEIDLTLDQEDITKSEGKVSFGFDGLAFREGSQIYGMDFETVFSECGGLINVENGRATIEWARFKGDKLEGEVTGYISLKESLAKSRLALKVRFKLVDESLETLASMQMGANPAHKDDKGYYHYMLSGPLERPRPREDRAAARRANRGSSRSNAKEDQEEREAPEERSSRRSKRLDEMSDEERAEWEAEREERREALRKKREDRRKELEDRRSESRDRVHQKDAGFSDEVRVGSTVRTGDLEDGEDEDDGEDEGEEDEDYRIVGPDGDEELVDPPGEEFDEGGGTEAGDEEYQD